MAKFTVTYEIVTPESAENGDAESRGFVLPGEWHMPIGEALSDGAASPAMDLRAAMQLAYPQEDCGRWFSEIDGRQNYRTGAIETRAIHPPANITAASYARLARLFSL